MSCRAFSRRIEHQMLRALFDKFQVDRVRFDFARTDRNGPLREFLDAVASFDPAGVAVAARDNFLAQCPRLFAKVHEE